MGCWQELQNYSSGGGRHPGLGWRVRGAMVWPAPGGTWVRSTAIGTIGHARGTLNECHLMEKPNHSPGHPQRGSVLKVRAEQLGVVSLQTLSRRCGEGTRWNLGIQSGEQKLFLQVGVCGFIGNFTVQAAKLCNKGKRNSHWVKELMGIWKLDSYCSQNSKWHTMNTSQWKWLYMKTGMAHRWHIAVLTRYTCVVLTPFGSLLCAIWWFPCWTDCMLIAVEQRVNKYLLIFEEQKFPL